MNVAIKINGTTVTSRVISYEREHKICTGIGTLTLTLDGTYSGSIVPWSTVDIYENGDYKVRYYVSQVSKEAPDGTKVLECQDISKRVVDYFIPDSFTIDYPSYNKFWISKFLDDAGVEYEYATSSPGALLSNFTQLGLTSAYDQIQTLLQMSGWYMYFDGNEKAIIGALDIDLAEDHGSVGKTDILDIKVVTNDKMLRNKALVFGAYDPYTGTNAKASVTVHTPWNYDQNDLRPIVISNSNIPDNGTAYGMANQIIKEFARLTKEKHITLWGARNYNLGTALRVTSNVWKGRGLITTFGVSMNNGGLTTNVILDERCPRLFGFFDFGDYVYVATYGDGVWRKHIKFDPTWYNFSTGLTNLAITDMHINQGVFGSVSASGDIFYAIDDLPWHPLIASGFTSSVEDNVDTSVPFDEIPMTAFSGLMARAIIVDKETNTVKFAIDNASGINYGDYFLDHRQTTISGAVGSGIISASGAGSNFAGKRSWIAEYDVLAGIMEPTTYPVSLSGCYAYTILDIENDGINDYVSVATSGNVIEAVNSSYNFGTYTAYDPFITNDNNSLVAYNLYDDFNEDGQSKSGSGSANLDKVFVFNNEINQDREILWIENVSGTYRIKRTSIAKTGGTLVPTTIQSPGLPSNQCYIYKSGTDTYKVFRIGSHTLLGTQLLNETIMYSVWDANANTLSAETELANLIILKDTDKTSSTEHLEPSTPIVINNKLYHYYMHFGYNDGTSSHLTNYIKFYLISVDYESASATAGLVDAMSFTPAAAGLGKPKWNIFSFTGSFPLPRWLYQHNNNPAIVFVVREWNNPTAPSSTSLKNWLVYSMDGTSFTRVIIEQVTVYNAPQWLLNADSTHSGGAQLTNDSFVVYYAKGSDTRCYVFNSLTLTIAGLSSAGNIPFTWNPDSVWPMFGVYDDFYIANNGTDWYKCDKYGLTATSIIDFPTGYDAVKPFSTSHSISPLYYWQAYNNDSGENEILRYSSTGYMGSSIKPYAGFNFTQRNGIIAGNFFVEGNPLTPGLTKWLYIDNANPDSIGTIYQILQRTLDDEGNLEFKLIEQENYPMRVDISHNAPVLTVGSGDPTFQSNYVYENSLTTIQPVPSGVLITASGNQVNDYRYAYLEPTYGAVTSSGLGIQTTIVYVSSGIIYAADAATYSGGFQALYDIPSGYTGTRIETSNFGIGGQYIFITTSGDVQQFFQKDPGDLSTFIMYSGLPQSYATIIRLDDVI